MSFLAQQTTQPLEIKEIKLLQDCKNDLAFHMPFDKLVKFSEDLRRSRVISKEVNDIFASLDHARVDSQLRMRYILQDVCDGVKRDIKVFHRFVNVVAGLGGSAEGVAKRLHEQWCVSERGEGRESRPPSDEAEGSQAVGDDISLSEDHLTLLMKCLVGVTHKWEILGIALGLPEYVYENCRSERNNPVSLRNILYAWITGKYQKAVPATINNLKRVLASPLVGRGDVAESLEEKFREAMKPCLPLPESQRPSSDSTLTIDRLSTDTKVSDGKSTLLEVHVRFNGSVTYQWMKDGECLSDGLVFFRTSSDIIAISPASQGIQGKYTCRINKDSEDEVNTDEILLNVIFPNEKKLLITLYSRRREIIPDSWPLVGTKTFINLALVKKDKEGADNYIRGDEDDIREGEEKVEYEEVFWRFESRALVLVEGRPGSGKTTLVHKITRDWAKRGNVLKNAKLVFLISLRSLSSKKDESLLDILKPFYAVKEVCEKLVDDILASDGEGICFIIDGLDEYRRRDESDSVIYRLLHQRENYLAEAMVIVASRSVATGELRREPQVSKRVEVLGFSKQQIFDYIQEYTFSSDLSKSDASPAELKEYLNSHPNVLHMCYLPLHVAMICYLYKHLRGDIPRTETGIYEKFTKQIVLRTLKRSKKDIRLHSLDELLGKEKEHFRKICELALDMTFHSKQVVQQDHTTVLSPGASPNDAHCLGLVTIDRTAGLDGFDNTLTFLHLTLQEFLAAFNLAKRAEEIGDMSLILSYAGEKHMNMVCKFFFGLVKIQDFVFQQNIIQCVSRKVVMTAWMMPNDVLLFELQCAFESQDCHACSSIVREREGLLNLSGCTLTHADLTAVGYVISNTTHLVTELLMNACHLHDDKVRTLLSEVSHSKLKCILSLNLSYNNIGYDGATALAEALKSCINLQTLKLSNNNIGDDAAALVGGLKSCINLQTLKLSHNNIGDDGAKALSKELCCDKLQELDLSFNNIGVDGAAALAGALVSCKNLRVLFLTNNNIGDVGAEALAGGLKSCNDLRALLVNGNNIGDRGAVALGDGLKSYNNLQGLYLSNNNIGDRGAVALGDGLKSCNDLQRMELASNNIGDDGAAALADGLKSCNDLQELTLSSNNIGDDGAAALADGLKSCDDLRAVDIHNNHISRCAAAALSDMCFHPEDFF